jgi:predicted outer membrane protein
MGPTPDLTMLDLGLNVDAAKMRLEESKQRRVEARAEILGTACQAEVDRERRRLAAARSPVGYEKSASVSYFSKTGGPAEMSATCARNCANETDVGAAHDGRVPCRAGLLANVGGVNR